MREVSIEALYDNPDTNAWVESKTVYPEGYGDTWVLIGGLDKLTDGSGYILEFGQTGEIKVPNDFTVYIEDHKVLFTDEEKADMKWESQ